MVSTRGTPRGPTTTRRTGTGASAGNVPTAPTEITMDAAQIQALLLDMRPPQPVPQPVQMAPVQGPAFALTLGQANANQFIDYKTATGIKLW